MNVLIADDELLARRRLHRLLSEMPDVDIVGEAADGEATLAALKATPVDAVLLDIQMPGINGLEAAARLCANGPRVIFCTAHAEHAVAAFEQGAVDYLLKPIEPMRLRKALDRAADRQRSAGPSAARIPITGRHGVALLDPLSITHAVLEGELVTIHTDGGSHLTDLPLQSLHAMLPKDRFERVHRRALLNLHAVTRLEPLPSGGYLARTRQNAAVEISRQAARALRRRLGLRKTPEEAQDESP